MFGRSGTAALEPQRALTLAAAGLCLFSTVSGCTPTAPQFATLTSAPEATRPATAAPGERTTTELAPLPRNVVFNLVARFFRVAGDPNADLEAVLDEGAHIRLGSRSVTYRSGSAFHLDFQGGSSGVPFDPTSLSVTSFQTGLAPSPEQLANPRVVARAHVDVTRGTHAGRWTFLVARSSRGLLIAEVVHAR